MTQADNNIEKLKNYIFKSLHKNSEELEQQNLNTEINMLYKDIYGKDFDTEAYFKTHKSLFLSGPPASGKVANLIEAAKEVSQELNLKYVDYYANSEHFSKKDLVVSIHDNYGDNSFLFGSMPQGFTLEQIEKKEFMMKKSLGSILILDRVDELLPEQQKQLGKALSNGEIGQNTLLAFTSTKPIIDLDAELQRQLDVIEHTTPTLDKISKLRERFETSIISNEEKKINKIK